RGDVVIGDRGDRVGVGTGECLPFDVLGHRRGAEHDPGQVRLAIEAEMPEQFRGPFDAEHENTGSHRIQRACVPDFAGPHDATHPGDDVVRGHPGRFVDDDKAGGRWGVLLTSHAPQGKWAAAYSSRSIPIRISSWNTDRWCTAARRLPSSTKPSLRYTCAARSLNDHTPSSILCTPSSSNAIRNATRVASVP